MRCGPAPELQLKLLSPLVSDVVSQYCEISVFSHASLFGIDKNTAAPISTVFAQSGTLPVLSVLIGWTTLRFLAAGDVGTS